MEKRNKTAFEELLKQYGVEDDYKEVVNWEETEKGKNYNLLIPALVLEGEWTYIKKMMLGFVFTSMKKNGELRMTNKRIGKFLSVNENTVSTTIRSLIKDGFIEQKDKGYVLDDEFVEEIKKRKGRTILLPFEVFNSKLNAGAKILWGEYNSLSKGQIPYKYGREFISKQLNMSESSISTWNTLLYDNDFLTTYEVFSGYKFKKMIIITKKFEREDVVDSYEDIEE